MTTTLFGGAALVALLYFLLRLIGVSNYWRGVISGAVPIVGMTIYNLSHWQGGDVLTIHVAVYVATATALVLTMGRSKAERHRIHWIPMLIVVFFLGLTGLMAAFLTISTRGLHPAIAQLIMPNATGKPIHTAFSGEIPHDQEAAKTVSHYLSKTAKQRSLGWQIEVDGLEDVRRGQAGEVAVTVRDGKGEPLDHAAIRLSLSRPAGSNGGVNLALAPAGDGRYTGRLQVDQPGNWVAVLEIERGPDKFETAKNLHIPVL